MVALVSSANGASLCGCTDLAKSSYLDRQLYPHKVKTRLNTNRCSSQNHRLMDAEVDQVVYEHLPSLGRYSSTTKQQHEQRVSSSLTLDLALHCI